MHAAGEALEPAGVDLHVVDDLAHGGVLARGRREPETFPVDRLFRDLPEHSFTQATPTRKRRDVDSRAM